MQSEAILHVTVCVTAICLEGIGSACILDQVWKFVMAAHRLMGV